MLDIEVLIHKITNLVEGLQNTYCNEFEVEIIFRSNIAFRSILYCKNCMAQIIVDIPQFAPYRCVL